MSGQAGLFLKVEAVKKSTFSMFSFATFNEYTPLQDGSPCMLVPLLAFFSL